MARAADGKGAPRVAYIYADEDFRPVGPHNMDLVLQLIHGTTAREQFEAVLAAATPPDHKSDAKDAPPKWTFRVAGQLGLSSTEHINSLCALGPVMWWVPASLVESAKAAYADEPRVAVVEIPPQLMQPRVRRAGV